jgi:hypothetical protein
MSRLYSVSTASDSEEDDILILPTRNYGSGTRASKYSVTLPLDSDEEDASGDDGSYEVMDRQPYHRAQEVNQQKASSKYDISFSSSDEDDEEYNEDEDEDEEMDQDELDEEEDEIVENQSEPAKVEEQEASKPQVASVIIKTETQTTESQ